MAFDRIQPPDLWPSTTARLLYRLVCLWSTGTSPSFSEFLPEALNRHVEPMDESQILGAFGIIPDKKQSS
jgi:hypothetical protein